MRILLEYIIRMGIRNRLAEVLKSYLNDDNDPILGRHSAGNAGGYSDPDVREAFEELDDFLNSKKTGASFTDSAAGSAGARRKASGGSGQTPECLRPDFEELGLPLGASLEDCKAAYKKLLKLHHPDRHAGHTGNMKKATEKSARINAAFDRIERWRQTGRTD
jgi:hypothetical protein